MGSARSWNGQGANKTGDCPGVTTPTVAQLKIDGRQGAVCWNADSDYCNEQHIISTSCVCVNANVDEAFVIGRRIRRNVCRHANVGANAVSYEAIDCETAEREEMDRSYT